MIIHSRALAVSVLSSAFLLVVLSAIPSAHAQSNTTPPTTATRPTTPDQTSIPNNNPPASTTQTTGQASQVPKIKEMNEKEKGKVERQGK
ncbi:hypothetical protein JQ596_32785 [Bradyrhizobium manausense]|uniref:hypothetical protein n=1 Tax=Bradyrhizobium TaxID=374 RepID=UPI001BAA703E|nr:MULTISPECIES: hypothetical protein [Bradyrhizobium]MBR0830293.1 hypothetical protein [Bradyrhizobium manausense]UVO31594.1 hypothetical protein KUF59_13700 [Bradyrhizobium arachidis]